MSRALARLRLASMLAGRDAMALAPRRLTAGDGGVQPDAIAAAIGWLCRTHDVTGRRGSSKGFSLLHGWLPAYPETTGYVIGTLLDFARRTGEPALVRRARELGDWEVTMQQADGGVMEGAVAAAPRRSIVFNTGMVLHGWIDLEQGGHAGYHAAAARASRFLVDNLRDDGTWEPRAEYSGLPHTYNARVAWAMIRWAELSGERDARAAAMRHLDWVLSMQRDNGWFEACVFKPGMAPSTHGIAYTLRGLVESAALLEDERYLAAAARTSEVLMEELWRRRHLPANYDRDWQPRGSHACLTGTVQLGGVWLRLHQVTGERRFLAAGIRATEQAAARQERRGPDQVRGALAGSFPIWGRYAPLQYPNWATKFLADSLMLRADCLSL